MVPRRQPLLVALSAVLLALACAASPAAAAAAAKPCDPKTDCCNCCDPRTNPTTCTKAKCGAATPPIPFNPAYDKAIGLNPGCIPADHSIGTNQTFTWSCFMLGGALFLTILSMCGIDYTNDTLLFARFTASGAGLKRE